MDYDRFMAIERVNMEEIAGWIANDPSEDTLRKCASAVCFRIILTYPYMHNDVDTAFKHAWYIIENYLIPMSADKINVQKNFKNINNNVSKISTSNTQNKVTIEDIGTLLFGLIWLVIGVPILFSGKGAGAIFTGIILIFFAGLTVYAFFEVKIRKK